MVSDDTLHTYTLHIVQRGRWFKSRITTVTEAPTMAAAIELEDRNMRARQQIFNKMGAPVEEHIESIHLGI